MQTLKGEKKEKKRKHKKTAQHGLSISDYWGVHCQTILIWFIYIFAAVFWNMQIDLHNSFGEPPSSVSSFCILYYASLLCFC